MRYDGKLMRERTAMTVHQNPRVSSHHRQQGFVLIVALVLLLVLTILGLAATQSTALEEKMAGNARNHDLAFQAAEAGLRAGEGGMRAALWNNFTGDTAGQYFVNPAALPTTPIWETPGVWGNPASVISYPAVAATNIPAVAAQPQIVIEQLPPVSSPGQNLSQQQYGGGTPPIQLYRITVLGTGGDSTSTVMLQSVYRP